MGEYALHIKMLLTKVLAQLVEGTKLFFTHTITLQSSYVWPWYASLMSRLSNRLIFPQTLMYVGLGSSAYAAFGRETPGNIMTEFGFYKPYCMSCLTKFLPP